MTTRIVSSVASEGLICSRSPDTPVKLQPGPANRWSPCLTGRPHRYAGRAGGRQLMNARNAEERTGRLLEVGRAIVSELDTEILLQRILDEARAITGARYVALGVLDEHRRELERFVTSGVDAETHRAIGEVPRGRGVLGVLIEGPRPLRLADVGRHPQSFGF